MGGWSPSCPDGWTMFDIQCLLYVPQNMTWVEAEVIRMIPYSECFYTKLTLYLLAHLVNWHLAFGVPLLMLFFLLSCSYSVYLYCRKTASPTTWPCRETL